jgi:hypothetical protein
MYVRIARFENAEGNWDERLAEIRKRITGGGEGTLMEGARGAVKRAMVLVDRENGRSAGLIFCETEEDLRRVDDAMSQMSPPADGGSRTSVEMYEVAIDADPSA